MATATVAAKVMTDGSQKTKIVPTGQKMGWIEARQILDVQGKRMPTNVDYDKVLVGSEDWRQIEAVFPAWTDSVLVYPEKGGKFKSGRNVVDAYKDDARNEWVFDVSCAPKEAFGKMGVALYVEHPIIKIDGKRVILSAGQDSTIVVLTNFIQESGQVGRVDEGTRVPLAVSEKEFENLPRDQKRWLWRIDEQGVRPLVRDFDGYDYRGRRVVYAVGGQDVRFGVAQLETAREAGAPQTVRLLRVGADEKLQITLRDGQKMMVDAKEVEVVTANK